MDIDYSSDARVLLATCFPVFRDIVLNYVKKTQSENQYLLRQEQIDEVYQSPYHQFLIKDVAEVGVKLIELRKKVYDLTLQLEMQKNVIFQAITKLQDRMKSEKIDLKIGKENEKKLVQELDKTNDSINTLKQIVDSEIKSLLAKFDEMMASHNKRWQEFRTKNTEELIKALQEQNLLYENERQLLLRQETVQEILADLKG